MKLDIFNTTNRHSLDKISCYEIPIADVLNYYNHLSGDLFIMIAKVFECFKINRNESSKELAMEFAQDKIGFTVEKFSYYNSEKIAKSISEGIPVIVCANLKELFYCKHYGRNNWPHWFLVKGFDGYTQVFYVLDNLQFSTLGKELDEFVLTDKILKKLSKSYGKVYHKESFFRLVNNNQFNYYEALINILELYLSYDKTNNNIYAQKIGLENILILRTQTGMGNIIEEIKKKLVNINKFKELFAFELSRHLKIFGLDKHSASLLQLGEKNAKLWANFVLRNTVNISKNECDEIIISSKIIECERDLHNLIEEILVDVKINANMISNKYYSINNKKSNNTVTETSIITGTVKSTKGNLDVLFDNNEDEIISIIDKGISFKFNTGKIYNWWLDDDAPKAILINEDITNKRVKLRCKIDVNQNISEEKFQIGIFVRNRNNEQMLDKGYLGAVDYDNNCVVSEVGKKEIDKNWKFQNSFELYMEIYNDNISFGFVKNKNEELIGNIEFNNVGKSQVGFVCKTWGNGGKLEVDFMDIDLLVSEI